MADVTDLPEMPEMPDGGEARDHEASERRVPKAHVPDPIPTAARGFQGLRAGVVTRTIAGAVDYAVVTTLTVGTWASYVVVLFLIKPIDFTLPTWPLWVFLVLGYSYMTLYLWTGWAWTGRTFGARLMGLRVVDHRGNRLHWTVALLRAAFCALVPLLLWWCAISRENRSIPDVLLRTSVIHDWPVRTAVPAVGEHLDA